MNLKKLKNLCGGVVKMNFIMWNLFKNRIYFKKWKRINFDFLFNSYK